jgi:hypothetical protein
MPPIGGALRFVFYAGLLVLCVVDRPTPLHAAPLIGRTERVLYTPVGLFRVLGIRWVAPGVLRAVTVLTVLAWIGAAVGLLQPLTGVLTFLGFAFLHGVNAGALGSNHSTHSALYALFCLSFSVSHDAWSLDRYLASRTGWPMLVAPGSVLETGFAPRLMLVFLVYCMFAGGVSKLRNGGIRWLDGRALRFYVAESTMCARWPAFARFLARSPRLCRGLAWFTLVVELGAVAALWDSPLRLVLVLGWSALHVGILLVMMPAYWVQMWCYTLILDWRQLLAAVAPGGAGAASTGPACCADLPGARLLSAVGWLFCLGLVVYLWRQKEHWPLTTVPMYSNGAPPDEDGPPAREELKARAERARRGDAGAWKRPWVAAEAWQDIRIVPAEDRAPVPLIEAVDRQRDMKFVRWSQFAKVVREVAIADLAAKPEGRIEFHASGAEFPASRFLRDLVPVVRNGLPDWRQYRRLELVCRTDSEWVVIGEANL